MLWMMPSMQPYLSLAHAREQDTCLPTMLSRGEAEPTFRLVLADIAVLGHAEVGVALPRWAHADAVVGVGWMGFSWQPVLTALQIKPFSSLLCSSACKIIESNPDVQAPSRKKPKQNNKTIVGGGDFRES